MKNIIIALLLACLAIMSSFSSFAQQDGIKVVGKASAAMVPDTFMVRLSFEQRGSSASKLKQIVDGQTTSLVTYAKSLGIAERYITSSQMTVSVRYLKPEEQAGRVYMPTPNQKSALLETTVPNKQPHAKQIEFIVSRTVKVVMKDLSHYDRLLDSVVKMGVTRIDPVQSYVETNGNTYQLLMENAFKNAKEKAELLAQQAGGSLGNVISIEELSHYQARPRMMAAEQSKFHSSQAGTQNLSAEVAVRFAINH